MSQALPHSALIHKELDELLDEISDAVADNTAVARSNADFAGLFKTTVAMVTVLRGAERSGMHLVDASIASMHRLIALITLGQTFGVQLELRRVIELAVWSCYFCDHPVEWARLVESPSSAIVRDQDDPVSYCAFRDVRWYLNYVQSIATGDPSGMMRTAADRLSTTYGDLSRGVHSRVEGVAGPEVTWSVTELDDVIIKGVHKKVKQVTRDVAIIFTGCMPGIINYLDAMDRAWFDWLIGKESARFIRSAPFGIQR